MSKPKPIKLTDKHISHLQKALDEMNAFWKAFWESTEWDVMGEYVDEFFTTKTPTEIHCQDIIEALEEMIESAPEFYKWVKEKIHKDRFIWED